MNDQDVFWVGAPGEGGPQIRRIEVPGVGNDVRQEVIRIGPRGDCTLVGGCGQGFRESAAGSTPRARVSFGLISRER